MHKLTDAPAHTNTQFLDPSRPCVIQHHKSNQSLDDRRWNPGQPEKGKSESSLLCTQTHGLHTVQPTHLAVWTQMTVVTCCFWFLFAYKWPPSTWKLARWYVCVCMCVRLCVCLCVYSNIAHCKPNFPPPFRHLLSCPLETCLSGSAAPPPPPCRWLHNAQLILHLEQTLLVNDIPICPRRLYKSNWSTDL